MEVSTIWGMIDARCIVFPARSSGLNALTLLFRTPVEQARPFLGGGAFEFVRSDADTVDVYVSFHDFTSGDWGRSRTFDVSMAVRPVGSTADDERDGVYLAEALVNRRFTGEVAYWSLGISRRPGTIELGVEGDEVVAVATEGRYEALRVRMPAAVAPGVTRYPNRAYSYLHREPYVVPFDIDIADPVVDPAAVRLEVGTGRIARALTAIGLPRAPDAVSWGTQVGYTLHAPFPLAP